MVATPKFVHNGPRSSPTHPPEDNPSYSHREDRDGACGTDLGTTHAHKRSNVKISESHGRRFDLPEPSGKVR